MSETEKIIFTRYIDSISKPPIPRGITAPEVRLDPSKRAAGDPIVHQRTTRRHGKDVGQAPLYNSEVNAIQQSRELVPNRRGIIPQYDLNVPYFVLRRADLLDPVMTAYRASQRAASREGIALTSDLNVMAKLLRRPSRERVMEFAYGQSPQGRRILERNGREVPTLTNNERAFYDAARNLYDETWLRISEVREAIGKEPIDYEPDYFTFMRTFTTAEKLGIGANIVFDSAAKLRKQHQNFVNTPFPFGKKRTGAAYKAEFDSFKILNDYMQSATKQIHLAPFLAKLDELINHPLPNPVSGKPTWQLAQHKPQLHTYLQNWKNFLTTGVQSILPKPIRNTVYAAMGNLSMSLLGANIRSAGVQLGALRGTLYDFGPRWLVEGVSDSVSDLTLRTKHRNFALQNSKVLDTRGMQDTYSEVASAIIGHSPKDFVTAVRNGNYLELQRTIGKPAFKLLELMDGEAAMYTWRTAYNFATKKLSYVGERAFNFADDAVVRTQGGTMPGDMAGVQRTLSGRGVTQFQRFLNNDFNYFLEDVMGVKESVRHLNVDPNKWAPFYVKNVLKFVAATTAFNIIFEDLLQINSPFPTPVRDIRKGIDANENAFQLAGRLVGSLIEPLPIIGATRYGRGPGGPLVETIEDVTDSLRGDPLVPKLTKRGDTALEATARIYGSPIAKLLGAPGSGQVAKIVRGNDRSASVWPSLVGFSEEPKKPGNVTIRRRLPRPAVGIRKLR